MIKVLNARTVIIQNAKRLHKRIIEVVSEKRFYYTSSSFSEAESFVHVSNISMSQKLCQTNFGEYD